MADLSWINNIRAEDIPWWRNRIDTMVPEQERAAWHSRFDEIEHRAQGIDLSWINNMTAFERETLAARVRAQQEQAQNQNPATPQPTQGQKDAFDTFKGVLATYGLSSMADKTWQWIVDNGLENAKGNQFQLWLYEQEEFKQRFPGLKDLQAAGRAITPEQYINLETTYKQVMRQAGLNEQFFDSPDDFTELIANEVSPAEFQNRMEEGFRRVSTASPLVREAFKKYFGVQGDNALAAFFIDPDRSLPALSRMVTQSEISASFAEMGMQLDLNSASRLEQKGFTRETAAESARRVFGLRSALQQGINEAAIPLSETPTAAPEGQSASEVSMTEEDRLAVESILDPKVAERLQQRIDQRRLSVAGQPQQTVTTRTGRTSLG